MNKDIDIALNYHENTKHSQMSLLTSRHYLDWANRPIPFKIYTELKPIPLPTDFPIPTLDTISAISHISAINQKIGNDNSKEQYIHKKNSNGEFTTKELLAILFFSSGITREIKYDNSTYYMRAASATGALYPIELYIICEKIDNSIKSGIYHFNPADFSLTMLRNGDYKKELSLLVENAQDILESPLIIVFTSIAWRNSWKYQSRSYRHWFWDGGVIAANLLAITNSLNLQSKVLNGFVDDKVNDLLILQKEKEEAIAIIPIGIGLSRSNYTMRSENKEINKVSLPVIRPLSKEEIQYPEIWKIHNSSKLHSSDEVKEWTKSGQNWNFYNDIHKDHNLFNNKSSNEYTLKINQISQKISSISNVILKRGSTRRFTRKPIQFTTLSNILYYSTRGISNDVKSYSDIIIDTYLIVNSVEGVLPGGYFYDYENNALIQIKESSREIAENLCLDQSLFGDASVVLFLMTDLNKILRILGNRGYRVAQFESGIITGRIYLLSYASGIGASGSTFYDNAVTEFFSPHAKEKNTMIAVGIGMPAYKSKSGKMVPARISRERLLN